MGLDMYLEKRRFLSSFNEKDKLIAREINKLLGIDPDKADPFGDIGVKEVTVAAGYWRKANAIHNWFIQNCAPDGADDCRAFHVSQENLEELYDEVCDALKNKDATILEPVSGFFFGSTEIDDGYWQDLKYTKKIVKAALDFLKASKGKYWDYYYHASW